MLSYLAVMEETNKTVIPGTGKYSFFALRGVRQDSHRNHLWYYHVISNWPCAIINSTEQLTSTVKEPERRCWPTRRQ